jgi:hypothetical protein
MRVQLILDNRQQVALVTLLEIAKNSHSHLHMLISFFTLLIYLRIVSTQYSLLYLQQLVNLLKDLQSESDISV